MEVRGPFGPDGSDGVGPPTMPAEYSARTAPHWPPVVTGPPTRPIAKRRPRSWPRRIAVVLVLLMAGLLAQVVIYRFVMPAWTPAMMVNSLMGQPVRQAWVPMERISPSLVRAVIASEDARFCVHRGVDFGELKAAIDEARNGASPRGASTITMQVVKNVFLWPGRSYVRKALEFPLALWIDFILPKKRILELYLNVAEWGPSGQFGAEAGARHAFGKGAGALSPHQAALLAATLPNPVTRSARAPSAHIRRLAGTYTARARSAAISACWSRNS